LIDTHHIEDDENDENGQQATRKYEQVLTFQPLELDAFSNAFTPIICGWLSIMTRKRIYSWFF
jgi:hypothetical protein